MGQAIQSTREGTSPQVSGDHLLLTVLGTKPRPTCYVLGDKKSVAKFAPVALLNLLSDPPSHILALCTPEAERESWPLLNDDLDDQCQTTLLPITTSDSPEDQVNAYLETITKAVPMNAKVTVDVTHGFRHFSFLTYIAVLYLSALRHGVEVCGAYYGFLGESNQSQFVDLGPLLKLPDWIYALKVIEETGSTLPLANIIKSLKRKQIPTIAKELENLSQIYLSGLPIELGRFAQRILCQEQLQQLRKLLKKERLPCGEELVCHLNKILEPFETKSIEISGSEWEKTRVKLNDKELKRQAEIIDRLFKHGNVANALRLLNEWTISWVIWNNGEEKQWLDYEKERPDLLPIFFT